MSEAQHSEYSASQFEADMLCPGRRIMQRGLTRGSNIYAFSGTCMHEVHDECMKTGAAASGHVGRSWTGEGFTYTLDDDGADIVDCSLNHMRELTAGADSVETEVRVHYGRFIGVDDSRAWGTADVLALRLADREIFVGDLKTGRDPVDADSPQLKLYGAGALAAYEDFADVDTIRLAITQPKDQRAPKEHVISVAELRSWLAGPATDAVRNIQMAEKCYPDASDGTLDEWQKQFLNPNEKSCKWCAAKATCPAARADLARTATGAVPASPDEFSDLDALPVNEHSDQDWLEVLVEKADMFEDMLKAARAELERRLLAGQPSKKFKLVAGKRGARQWTSAEAAEAALKTFRLKVEEMYDLKLISPTSAEKLAKAEAIGPRQWTKLQSLIVQKDGSPHVAPLADKRPALEIRPVVEDFDLA
jgi:hypothetical protein